MCICIYIYISRNGGLGRQAGPLGGEGGLGRQAGPLGPGAGLGGHYGRGSTHKFERACPRPLEFVCVSPSIVLTPPGKSMEQFLFHAQFFGTNFVPKNVLYVKHVEKPLVFLGFCSIFYGTKFVFFGTKFVPKNTNFVP
jgi:hypothetical protein